MSAFFHKRIILHGKNRFFFPGRETDPRLPRFCFSLGFQDEPYKILPIMNLLAIETSGPVLSVAVKKGARPGKHLCLKGFSRHVENLIPLIDRLLTKERLRIRDIDILLVGRGPGSFTGLRIGFSTIKGFLAARERPCFGASSLDLIASAVPPPHSPPAGRGAPCLGPGLFSSTLAVCLSAKRDKLYTCSYRYHGKGWKPLGAPSVEDPAAWLKRLPEDVMIAGSGLAICAADIQKKMTRLPEKYWFPKASALIKLYELKNPLLKRLIEPKDILPLYLRASEAEERLKI